MTVSYTNPNASDSNVALQSAISTLQTTVNNTLAGAAGTWPFGLTSMQQKLAKMQNELATNLMDNGRLPAALILSTFSLTAPSGESASQYVLDSLNNGTLSGAAILATMS